MLFTGCNQSPDEKSPQPNIILIMADDMGYSDISCYGGEIPSPNLDMLAENGIRFTQFYNGGRCCPTRAALLTGLYAHQAGVGAMVSPSERPGYLGRLNEECATFAEVLRLEGYQTFMSGKWHVTHYDYNDPESTLHPDIVAGAKGIRPVFRYTGRRRQFLYSCQSNVR
jgi:arylsulfatase A-like enzyme